jgi:hypothetical protein
MTSALNIGKTTRAAAAAQLAPRATSAANTESSVGPVVTKLGTARSTKPLTRLNIGLPLGGTGMKSTTPAASPAACRGEADGRRGPRTASEGTRRVTASAAAPCRSKVPQRCRTTTSRRLRHHHPLSLTGEGGAAASWSGFARQGAARVPQRRRAPGRAAQAALSARFFRAGRLRRKPAAAADDCRSEGAERRHPARCRAENRSATPH